MKRLLFSIMISLSLMLWGCAPQEPAQVAATTLAVEEFTQRICQGTNITVTRLVTEQVSCLHDYSLNVRQVKAAEAAETIVISGAGLEHFMEDLLSPEKTIDASLGISLRCPEEAHDSHEGHHHEEDPHIWLSPAMARQMAENICQGLRNQYPEHGDIFSANLNALLLELEALEDYGRQALSSLTCRELITFHDGFSYFAEAFDLTILEAVEEESGSEASAKELIHLIELVQAHQLPAIFTEKSGSISASSIIARETGCAEYALDMAMSGSSYFDAMYHNIHTIQEALG